MRASERMDQKVCSFSSRWTSSSARTSTVSRARPSSSTPLERRVEQRPIFRVALAAGEREMAAVNTAFAAADQHRPQFTVFATIYKDKHRSHDA